MHLWSRLYSIDCVVGPSGWKVNASSDDGKSTALIDTEDTGSRSDSLTARIEVSGVHL